MDIMNGSHITSQPAFPGNPYGSTKFTVEQVDPSTLGDDDDSDDDVGGHGPFGSGPRPGKKTKGRVKIRMEFIENKLRRYTTFSKRKTGIMKKAYELSTLTGTQVMLLVASETGHVYTFATRKLQPMITSESGKALIQTCLNSPDPPPMAPGQQQAVEQRMNPTGFEETELTYAVSEEESKAMGLDTSGLKPMFALSGAPEQVYAPPTNVAGQNFQAQTSAQPAAVQSTTNYIQAVTSSPARSSPVSTTAASGSSMVATPKSSANMPGIAMQLPTVPSGGIIIQPGTPITIPIQTGGQQLGPGSQTVYRIPAPLQVVSKDNRTVLTEMQSSGALTLASPDTGQMVASTTASTGVNLVQAPASSQAASAMTPSVLMYQTPQGIMYAPAAAAATADKQQIFNFQQPATALSVQQTDQQGQQIITIPVPVSLAGSPQVLFTAGDGNVISDLSQATPAKKAKKS